MVSDVALGRLGPVLIVGHDVQVQGSKGLDRRDRRISELEDVTKDYIKPRQRRERQSEVEESPNG